MSATEETMTKSIIGYGATFELALVQDGDRWRVMESGHDTEVSGQSRQEALEAAWAAWAAWDITWIEQEDKMAHDKIETTLGELADWYGVPLDDDRDYPVTLYRDVGWHISDEKGLLRDEDWAPSSDEMALELAAEVS
jgi:hypothetical protein